MSVVGLGLMSVAAAWGAGPVTSLRILNAANYVSEIAAGGIAVVFADTSTTGVAFPTDSSTTVEVCQSGSCVQGTIYAAYPSQINFIVPATVKVGPLPALVVVEVLHGGTVVASGTIAITAYSPGILTADSTGRGIFAGESCVDCNKASDYQTIYTYGGQVTLPWNRIVVTSVNPRPLSPASGTVILFGSGWRGIPLSDVRVTVDGTSVTPEYSGATVYAGLDQLNLHIPPSLILTTTRLVDATITINNAPGSTTGSFSTNRVQLCIAGQDGAACPSPDIKEPPALCSDPLPGLTAPYAPHGIFVLQFPGADLTPVDNYIRQQPTVCGGNIFVVWAKVDKGVGIPYDWSGVDGQIAPWVAAGKSVNLVVWGVDQQVPNAGTPSYVLQDPTTQSVTCLTSRSDTTATYPVYYSAGYKTNYQRFMKAVMDRYGSNPSVGYIRFGLSRGGEAFPTCMAEMMQLTGNTSIAQFGTATWKPYIAEMTAFQKGLQDGIKKTSGRVVQLMGALNGYGDNTATDFEATNATSLGFGFGSQGLTMSDLDNYTKGSPCTSDWCTNFLALANMAVPLELQPFAATDPTNAPTGTGSLTDLLPFGLNLHAQIFELYIEDLQVAYDQGSPYWAIYHQSYQKVLEQTAAVVGGR